MSKKVTVPIDMSSEQKTILGIMSPRQLIYLVAGAFTIYAYVPTVFQLAPHWIIGFFMSFFAGLPVATIILLLAFRKKQKYNLYYDHYLLIKLNYKNEIGVWRKGSK
ncbi:PrgI family protein [Gracilibacillus sp. YIM 98692]|uniref:PrgI family mobile element protein n=1 Tax=Gracilibacillus sp. YIM 98692 TaxID=2663532 RepID=UPI0013D3289C|nr:PrgI family protein [Gracilibacillus sp. YIM 98692]